MEKVDGSKVIELAHELQSLASARLLYTKGQFDAERYGRIRDIAAEITAIASDCTLEKVKDIFASNDGYQIPKISTWAAIFNEKNEVLLVKDYEGRWVLPGGWCDYDQTIMSNVVKETLEEAGLLVQPYRLVGIFDNQKRPGSHSYFHAENAHVLCRVTGGEFHPNSETTESGYFSLDHLPELNVCKMNERELRLCLEGYLSDSWKPVVD